MAICIKCKCRDREHEQQMPSKRYEIQRGKKVEVCDGFSVIPPNFFDKEPLPVDPPKVIA